MFRLSPLCLLPLLFTVACDSPKEGGAAADGTGTAAAEKTPAVQAVVRKVAIQKTLTGAPLEGSDEGETYTALDGKVYAIVTADIAHKSCKDGDEIDSTKASLLMDGKPAGEVKGGGEDPTKLCVLCQAKTSAGCNGGAAKLKAFTFVFEVDEKADVKKAVMRYQDADAKLEVAEVSDLRGNEDLDAQIAQKKEQIAAMKKKLENTSNMARGKIIEGEIQSIEKEIAELEAKKKK